MAPLRLLPRRALLPPRPTMLLLTTQQRTLSWFNWGKAKDKTANPAETPSDSSTRSVAELLQRSPKTTMPAPGSLAPSSIFGDEAADAAAATGDPDPTASRLLRDPARSTWGWPRKAAARELRRRGRLSRPERIAQTEKEHTAASHFIKTSMKKLAPLARQISGKSVEDAIAQMRLSRKKAARAVLDQLLHTRDEAAVRRSMDPAEMYIAQAWVGKGPYGRAPNHRARGRIDILRLPYTSLSSLPSGALGGES